MPNKIRIYREDPAYVMQSAFLSNEVYAEAIAGMILVNTDAMIIDRATKVIWLAKRNVYPMRGLWIIGGRRLRGETPLQSMRRCFKRETGFDFPESRFKLLFKRPNDYQWSTRQQEPQDLGSHNFADTFIIELAPEERGAINLTAKEYEPGFGLQPFDRAALIQAGAHQALIDMYDKAFRFNWFFRLAGFIEWLARKL